MSRSSSVTASGETTALILRALVRKLVDKGVLSEDEVRALLVDAASGLDVDGGKLTPEAAKSIAGEDLAPLFLGPERAKPG